jgi:hypothetical protein
MDAIKIAAVALIAAGILGLVYGSFTYTKETHEAKFGPIEMSVKEKETANIPVWGGVGAIVLGGGLLLSSANQKWSLVSLPHCSLALPVTCFQLP